MHLNDKNNEPIKRVKWVHKLHRSSRLDIIRTHKFLPDMNGVFLTYKSGFAEKSKLESDRRPGFTVE